MPTALQIKLLCTAAGKVGLNDAQRKMLIRNLGGVDSSKLLSQSGFEDVMAALEDMGFVDSKHGPGYWAAKVSGRGRRGNERMVHLIRELCEGGRYPLESLVRRFSGDRTGDVEALTPREAWKLIECLKSIAAREGGTKAHGTSSVGSGKAAPQGRGRGHGAPNLFSAEC